MFWLEEGLPGTLAPGKRPRTTLTPSLALRDGKPYLAFGTPGGDQQEQWQLLFFLRHVHHGLNLQEAIDLPMSHRPFSPRPSIRGTASRGIWRWRPASGWRSSRRCASAATISKKCRNGRWAA